MGRSEATRGRALIVEDEYLLADELRQHVISAQLDVIGPVPDVASALSLLEGADAIDVAILDINLRGRPVFELAELLQERRVPIIFVTGYARENIPARFAKTPHLAKPVKKAQLEAMLDLVLPS